jgi:NADP-dependent 3-hydroxy acid dehydrogenase YdfG
MSGIRDKVVAITGAGSGIGEATAVLLAERGAEVVLAGRRVDRLEAVAKRISDAAVFRETDVRRRADVTALVDLAIERFGRLDVMISNAGFGANAPLDELRVQEWEDMIDINIKGVLYGVAAALPVFRKQGSGHFVHTLSTSGLRIVPTQGIYAGTKNAVRTISEALRQEAGDKLRVTTVSPGFTRTDMVYHSSSAEVVADLVARRDQIAIPPDAIARAIAFAIEQPAEVDVNEIVVRPTAQS